MARDVRIAFDRDGYVIVPAVLSPSEVAGYTSIVDATYEEHTVDAPEGRGPLHLLSAVHACPALAPLVAHPRILGPVWSILGWNIHMYHSHIDVHPPAATGDPYRFRWHQDGGRQNVELESDPSPRLSIKAAYWLSDVSRPGRGNLKVVPGSHTTPCIDGPPRPDLPWPEPPGAQEIVARPGDVVLFDRRLWHARSDNHSAIVRKAAFFAFTYRWVRRRDRASAMEPTYTPLQRQLLGLLENTDGDHEWGHDPRDVPLYEILRRSGQIADSARQRRSGAGLEPPEPRPSHSESCKCQPRV